MKKIRVVTAVLFVAMLFSLFSTSAFAGKEDGGLNEGFNRDLSKGATRFEAINAEGWDIDKLTLGGVPYDPFITERGYMLVRNCELTQAAVAPEVAKKLGLNPAEDFIIMDMKLSSSWITPELLDELAQIVGLTVDKLKENGTDIVYSNIDKVVNGLTSNDDIGTKVENFLNEIKEIEISNISNGKKFHDHLMDSPRYAEIYQILQEGNYAPQVAEALGKIEDKQPPVELVLTDGKNVMTFLCKNLASASDPGDQTYPCTTCGCAPCGCPQPVERPEETSPPS